jgi:hypothetical protein
MSTPEAAVTAAGTRGEATSADVVGEQIVRALGPLAASPLTEQAAARMRRVLARAASPAVRDALRRRSRPVAAADHRSLLATLAQAPAKVCRWPHTQPVTRPGVTGPGMVAAGAW